MLLGSVVIPGELLDAQADGKLVIFAGAGVSMPPPSNYPNFERLAEEIAAGTLRRGEGEPVERFLGRLEDRGRQVHQLVRQRLSQPDSKPNLLHDHLLTIASATGPLRLVTTNFDDHFSTCAAMRAPGQPETFFAPALPLGDTFEGVVYLHGSVLADASRMVLTDRDFAQAYLVRGWARRFLLSLFQGHTVLFVGYSHDDSVMSYLARGLPQRGGRGRFALTGAEQDREDHWRFLGITAIPYPQEYKDDHAALEEALREWARLSTFGAMDHDNRIKAILTGSPPLTPQDDDYLLASLTDPSRVQFFTSYARSPDWLRWAEGKQALDVLFQPYAQLDDCQAQLA